MKYLVGKLVLAGDIDIAEGEFVSGVVIKIPREELRDCPTLPMYETIALVPISEFEALRKCQPAPILADAPAVALESPHA